MIAVPARMLQQSESAGLPAKFLHRETNRAALANKQRNKRAITLLHCGRANAGVRLWQFPNQHHAYETD